MKTKAILLLTLIILGSCAHKKTEPHPQSTTHTPSVQNDKKSQGDTMAIFHVVDPLGVELVLTNLENQKEEIVLMDKTLSQLELKPAHYQVTGFILAGKTYKLMNTTQKFIFQIKKKKITYVGSYIFQCPKVNHQHLSEMKKMNFFNRYPFSSSQGLCEMVVGSDYKNVNRVWLELGKEKHRPLSLGF